MHVKRYEVSSISEALTRIKSDLGPDAIILSSKKIRGVNNQQRLEVLAAKDEQISLPDNSAGKNLSDIQINLSKKNNSEDLIAFLRSEIKEIKEIVRQSRPSSSEMTLRCELAELKETMDKFFDVLGMQKNTERENTAQQIYCHLLASGFSRGSACRILDAVNRLADGNDKINYQDSLKAVENFIVKSLTKTPQQNIKKRMKLFIGPTGVGKTTTLAKLAANYALTSNQNIGMITTDTFRIAAAEQLRTYAKIMGVRMEVASGEETLQKALRELADKDIILIDTPGRGRFDGGYMKLLPTLTNAGAVEKNLLISATASEDNLQDTISKYATVDYDNLIVTKIDEANRFGILYDILEKAKKPVTYVTNGQNVPQDIEKANPEKIAHLMLGNVLQ